MPQFDEQEQEKKLGALHRSEEENLMAVLAAKYGHQYINLNGISINTDALRLLDETTARAADLAVFEKRDKHIQVAIRNPNKPETQHALTELTEHGFTLEIFMVSSTSLSYVWARYADIKKATAKKKGVLDIASDEITRLATTITSVTDIARDMTRISGAKSARQVSEILEVILGGAIALHASDIHLEPEETAVRIRLRIDGVLIDVADIPNAVHSLLRARLKLLSGIKLNITDRAQDGRFTIDVGEKNLEIRSSVIPGGYGEAFVMRILDPSTIGLGMETLGINDTLLHLLDVELGRPNGMIITTGPTGSGKTTSLYAFLKKLYKPEIKVVTLEDPIEYHLTGIVQTQVHDDYTFASGLRAILRQDPDVIMVGEVRDRDVAETAVQAALTGHLVLSTLHTNSAVGAFPRLMDLGIDPRSIGSSTNLVLAQRLVRRLCEECKKAHVPTAEELDLLRSFLTGLPSAPDLTATLTVYDAVGCPTCGTTGFRGRIGIYEGIRVDSAVETAIIQDPREDNILAAAAPQGVPNMQQDGLIKVLAGLTSIEELSHTVDLHGEKGIRHSTPQTQPATETPLAPEETLDVVQSASDLPGILDDTTLTPPENTDIPAETDTTLESTDIPVAIPDAPVDIIDPPLEGITESPTDATP